MESRFRKKEHSETVVIKTSIDEMRSHETKLDHSDGIRERVYGGDHKIRLGLQRSIGRNFILSETNLKYRLKCVPSAELPQKRCLVGYKKNI